MAYCKKFIFLFLILFILFNFNYCFADSSIIEGTVISDLYCQPNSNYFVSYTGNNITCYPVKKGYIYDIKQVNTQFNRASVYSSEYPEANVVYQLIYNFQGTTDNDFTYSYYSTTDGYISINGNTTDIFVITERPSSNYTESVLGLVDSVGPNALWGVFGSGIDFVFVVVIVAFGIFIIYKLVKGFSKGKSKI